MSKFNQKQSLEDQYYNDPSAVQNFEGGLSFTPSKETELYLRCCTNLVGEDKFYVSGESDLKTLRDLIKSCSREFILKLAVYCRKELHLRSLPIMLLCEASNMYEKYPEEDKSIVRKYAPKIIQRADELMETTAYWINVIGDGKISNFPNALKKGIADSFYNFDEYQLSKYANRGSIKLKDVFFICHPRARNDKEYDLFAKIVEDKLIPADTWERKISSKGSSTQNWEEIADKMGIMALLRNLRNFEQHKAKKAIAIAKNRFRDKKSVLNSKQLPFRWLSASKHVQDIGLLDALDEAMEISIKNVPKLPGTTVIAIDISFSMEAPISEKSTVKRWEVGAMLGALAHTISEKALVYIFAEDIATLPMRKRNAILENMKYVQKTLGSIGHTTNAYKVIDEVKNLDLNVDRIILLSDMQTYNTNYFSNKQLSSEWKKFSQKSPQTYLYSIDVAGYGTASFLEKDKKVVLLGGWSDKVLNLISLYEKGGKIINYIKETY